MSNITEKEEPLQRIFLMGAEDTQLIDVFPLEIIREGQKEELRGAINEQ
ncbi:MAG: hypothetical protein JXA43_03360 [Candidatus Diapherotrites archaeon]|nr:hypothetical protein [Candidatus Diapherotrites archaeon]